MKDLFVVPIIICCSLSLGLVVMLASYFGIPAKKLHGAGLEFSAPVMGFVLLGLCLPIIIVFLSQKIIHQSSFLELGLREFGPNGSFLRTVIIGILLGISIHLLADGLTALLADSVKIHKNIPDEISLINWLPYYTWFLVLIFINSFSEELVYRSYPIQHLINYSYNKWLIIIGTSILFSIMHYFTDSFSWSNLIYRTLFGILVGIIYYETKSIWLIFGIHSGFNLIGMAFSQASWKSGGIVHIEFFHNSIIIPHLISIILSLLILSSNFWIRWIKLI